MKKLLAFLFLVGCNNKDYVTLNEAAPPAKPPTVNQGLNCNLYDLSLVQPIVMPVFSQDPTQTIPGTVYSGPSIKSYNETRTINFLTLADILHTSGSNLTSWVGLDCKGQFTVTTSQLYTLKLNSDDGSILYVDGYKVINNDGLHGATLKTANIALSQGLHDIELQYFEGGGPAVLQLFSNVNMEFSNVQ